MNSYQKIDSHLTNFFVYDLETRNTDRPKHYNMTCYRLGKLALKFNCDLTPYEKEKCLKNNLVFDRDNCISNALDFFI